MQLGRAVESIRGETLNLGFNALVCSFGDVHSFGKSQGTLEHRIQSLAGSLLDGTPATIIACGKVCLHSGESHVSAKPLSTGLCLR